ncbi:MAG: hypothetical protein KatS3mg076_0510 [Candidatus Binatia bacterium]|nr:MAG: hypothetical protein KatS3mg076_0510 [Candidatus Binatia bacterium]
MYRGRRVAVVVPAHNEARHLPGVLRAIPEFVDRVFVVDDGSTDGTSEAARAVSDPRIEVLRHEQPRGVGGATLAGFRRALEEGADLLAKVDGDGQMDPAFLPRLLDPLCDGCGYAKGNRFLHADALRRMPRPRLVGNFLLTFLTKLASGYWRIFDPQNGYVAARAEVLRLLDLGKISEDFFFENDMLIHLNVHGVRVCDVPLEARYGDEESSLRIRQVLLTFPYKLFRGFWYRVYEKYILRDFSPIGVFWFLGAPLLVWGTGFGLWTWARSLVTGHPATTGTVMLSVLPFLLGFELVLQAIILEIRESS